MVVSNSIVAYTYGLPLFSDLTFSAGIVVSLVGFILLLVATLVPTYSALSKATAAVLSVSNR